jgi:hypothetical protein
MSFSSSRLTRLPQTEALPRTAPQETETMPELPCSNDPRPLLWDAVVAKATSLQAERQIPLMTRHMSPGHLVACDLFLATMNYYTAHREEAMRLEILNTLSALAAVRHVQEIAEVALTLTGAVAVLSLCNAGRDSAVQHELACVQRWLYFA